MQPYLKWPDCSCTAVHVPGSRDLLGEPITAPVRNSRDRPIISSERVLGAPLLDDAMQELVKLYLTGQVT